MSNLVEQKYLTEDKFIVTKTSYSVKFKAFLLHRFLIIFSGNQLNSIFELFVVDEHKFRF